MKTKAKILSVDDVSAVSDFLGRECRSDRRDSTRTEKRGRCSLERRELTDAEKTAGYIGAIRGVIPFNSDSHVLTMRGRTKPFVERIAPDAFKRSLAEDKDIMATAGHSDDPLAAIGLIGENLTVTTNEREMVWDSLVPDTQAGKDLLRLIGLKIIRGTSFEFEVRGKTGEKWEKRDDNTDERTIVDARLLEFNPVKWPAYLDTALTVEMRKRPTGQQDERRSYWLYQDDDYMYGDPTITADAAFAQAALGAETSELTESLRYLRESPAGALADYARAQVTESAAAVKTLTDFLATNGATVNPDLQARAQEKLAEAREATKDKPISNPLPSARERRLRLL